MDEGLYESIFTHRLLETLSNSPLVPSEQSIDPGDQPHVLARHVAETVHRHLLGVSDPHERVRVVNSILRAIDRAEEVDVPIRHLHSLADPDRLASAPIVRPVTPLSEAALLTNAPDEPSLASELRAEIATSSHVDLVCAFVRWYGVRLLEAPLRELRDRGVPFRVITTTYLGSTERAALDRLVREFGAQVRVQYDAQRTRLHAKAWLFRRHTGFDTAYVGSSNLSRAALLEGVEWNVRLATGSTPSLLSKFEATFDAYWNDPSFEPYDPDVDRDRLDDALLEAGGQRAHNRVTISLTGLTVRPFPHQQQMLDALDAERQEHDRHRNLIVAATGTGKTVIAALDYRRLSDAARGQRPSLLFVAHRREILEQSIRTYREVLSDASFGEMFVGGQRPERWKHVFASVQSLSGHGVLTIPPDAFDVLVIDEFHHAQAPTYRSLLEYLQPNELLGLTATPERADGHDIREFFDGRTAAELRLWDAIGDDLLVPFHYFAAADGTDLTGVTWRSGQGYDQSQLAGLYTGNDARSAIVLNELRDKVLDLGGMCALGFCVSVEHAVYMTKVFNQAGIPAAALSGSSGADERVTVLAALRARELNVVFAVDLFNEGLDIPEIDTVLMLRPTESSTVFLQQLGRGLRRTANKPVLTVLDFVGLHRREFRFASRFQALTGLTRRDLEKAIPRQFPFLPSGCQIVLDRQAQSIVLENIRSHLARWPQLIAEARSLGDVPLDTFLDECGLEMADVLREGRRSWTELRRAAGLETSQRGPREVDLLKRVRALAHVDDADRLRSYARWAGGAGTALSEATAVEQRLASMLFFSLWPNGGGYQSVQAGLADLIHEPAVRAELEQVTAHAFDRSRHVTSPLPGVLGGTPLRVHAHYQREEVLAALGYAHLQRTPQSFREGVLFATDLNVDALFVTLKKSEADYSPTTMYRDYPIDPLHFHWESQSTTTVRSKTGQRYLGQTSDVLLFVREEARGPFGTAPFLFLGPVSYVKHVGERPIAITWRLDTPMPSEFFQAASVAAS